MAEVKVLLLEDVGKLKLSSPKIIVAFPSSGLVGTIAGVHLTQEHKFRLVGYITSESFAPVAAIHDYELLPPVRIMISEEMNVVCVVSEISIPISVSSKVADSIISIAKKFNAKEICLLSSTSEGEKPLYFVSTHKSTAQLLSKKLKALPLEEGALAGVGSMVLMKAELGGVEAFALLSPQKYDVVDPSASAALLSGISKLYGLKIDTKKLEQEAKALQKGIESSLGASFTGSMYR